MLTSLLVACVLTLCILSVIAAIHGTSGSEQAVLELAKLLFVPLGVVVGYYFGEKSGAEKGAGNSAKAGKRRQPKKLKHKSK